MKQQHIHQFNIIIICILFQYTQFIKSNQISNQTLQLANYNLQKFTSQPLMSSSKIFLRTQVPDWYNSFYQKILYSYSQKERLYHVSNSIHIKILQFSTDSINNYQKCINVLESKLKCLISLQKQKIQQCYRLANIPPFFIATLMLNTFYQIQVSRLNKSEVFQMYYEIFLGEMIKLKILYTDIEYIITSAIIFLKDYHKIEEVHQNKMQDQISQQNIHVRTFPKQNQQTQVLKPAQEKFRSSIFDYIKQNNHHNLDSRASKSKQAIKKFTKLQISDLKDSKQSFDLSLDSKAQKTIYQKRIYHKMTQSFHQYEFLINGFKIGPYLLQKKQLKLFFLTNLINKPNKEETEYIYQNFNKKLKQMQTFKIGGIQSRDKVAIFMGIRSQLSIQIEYKRLIKDIFQKYGTTSIFFQSEMLEDIFWKVYACFFKDSKLKLTIECYLQIIEKYFVGRKIQMIDTQHLVDTLSFRQFWKN